MPIELNPWWFAYAGLGMFSGLMAGLLGLGGGAVMVPVLVSLFALQAFPHEHVLHLALGTSMATIIFTAFASLRTHHQHGAVMWKLVRHMTPGILLGTFLGTLIAAHISTKSLALFFGLFILVVAIQMGFALKPHPSRQLPAPLGMAGVAVGIGTISALAAIGGGSMTVPFLTWCNVRVQHAIGTSAALGLPIALSATAGYLYNGWGQMHLPTGSIGYVYLPAFVCLLIASMLTAPIGARLAHKLPVATLKRVFAGVLLLLAGKMLWSVWGAA